MESLLIFVVAIVAGFVGAVSGGGSLLSIPLLLFIGVPVQTTLATNKFGGLGSGFGSLYKYIKNKKVVWEYVFGLSVAGVLGSLVGSQIFLTINQENLNTLTGVLLLILLPTIFFKKDFGIQEKKPTKTREFAGYCIYFFLAIVSSFFGGLGPILILNVIFLSGLPFIKANATEYFSSVILSVVSTSIFIINGIVDYKIGIILFIGMLLGGYLGANTAIKKGDAWVKRFFIIIVIISSVKILFF